MAVNVVTAQAPSNAGSVLWPLRGSVYCREEVGNIRASGHSPALGGGAEPQHLAHAGDQRHLLGDFARQAGRAHQQKESYDDQRDAPPPPAMTAPPVRR